MKGKIVQMVVLASLLISVSFFMTGCGDKKISSDEMAQQTAGEEMAAEAGGAQAGMGTEERMADTGDTMGEAESLQAGGSSGMGMEAAHEISEGRTHAPMLPVYFDFDKSTIREDQVGKMEGNANFMKENAGVDIVIEGNCDERGTSEYNIALGQRRADSAKKYLVNLGVDEGRINTISYGEEKPLVRGHDEHAWAQNRRDDFKIR